jgi:hypothetical protein
MWMDMRALCASAARRSSLNQHGDFRKRQMIYRTNFQAILRGAQRTATLDRLLLHEIALTLVGHLG